VFSNDKERDDYIRSGDFFNVAHFPKATFRAAQFARTEQGFTATGQLTMKGLTDQSVLTFTVENRDGKKILTGTAPIDRLAWNIGTGDWTDTSWVGQNVLVNVRVVASVADQ
jgi:polyisoprenoid-binding protein YceI